MQLLYVGLLPDVLSKRSPTMEPRVPSDTCYLAPDSFKLELSKINLIWSRTKFLSHRTARSYFLKLAFAQHRIPQHIFSTRSAILLYNRVGACIGRRWKVVRATAGVRTSSQVKGQGHQAAFRRDWKSSICSLREILLTSNGHIIFESELMLFVKNQNSSVLFETTACQS